MQQQPSGYRPIVPAPPTPQAFVPISPRHSPSTHPSTHPSPHHSPLAHPNLQQGVVSLPFETPPVSPFSHPMHNDYAGQLKLPPPMQLSTSLAMHSSQHVMLPISPTVIMSQQQSCTSTPRVQQSSQSSQSRYERILPKQSGPSTSVFPIPLNPSSGNSSIQGGTRPTMQHHTSVIHPLVPHHHSYRSASSDKPLTTADQRELARKVSHSAIERRRRERINDKIMQLKELIPSCADQDHLHKLSILQSAIEYIQYLQGRVTRQRERDGKDEDILSEEGRFAKRSKFDRYDILPPNSNSRNFESFDEERQEYKNIKKSSVNSTFGSLDDEERQEYKHIKKSSVNSTFGSLDDEERQEYKHIKKSSVNSTFGSLDDEERQEYKHIKKSFVNSTSSSPSSPSSSSSSQVTTGKSVKGTEEDEVKSDNDSITSTTTTVNAATPSSSPTSHDHEDARALLMLSNSESSMTKESDKQITTKDSETQTSPPHVWELSRESDSQESDNEQESPRRGMTVQQLLC